MVNSMFDELKEVKYFKEMTDFKSLIMLNTYNVKTIKRLKSLPKAEAYLESLGVSTMERYCEYT